jgi:hypothetical protein
MKIKHSGVRLDRPHSPAVTEFSPVARQQIMEAAVTSSIYRAVVRLIDRQ